MIKFFEILSLVFSIKHRTATAMLSITLEINVAEHNGMYSYHYRLSWADIKLLEIQDRLDLILLNFPDAVWKKAAAQKVPRKLSTQVSKRMIKDKIKITQQQA